MEGQGEIALGMRVGGVAGSPCNEGPCEGTREIQGALCVLSSAFRNHKVCYSVVL